MVINIDSYLESNKFISKSNLAKSWDFPYNGTELRMKIKNLFWKYFVSSSPYIFGYDGMIITNSSVLKTSGHLDNFYDWMITCIKCSKKFKIDNIITENEKSDFLKTEKKENFLFNTPCYKCGGKFSFPEKINLLIEVNIRNNSDNNFFLRPETCQSIFSNFPNAKKKKEQILPFGIAQIGKSYRNEPTLNHGIFRTREFEQMELEFFCEEKDIEKWWNEIIEKKSWFFIKKLINDKKRIKKIYVDKNDLPHYSEKTLDFYFRYKFGWGELCSNSYRGNYDLLKHSLGNKKDFRSMSEDKKMIIPHVIEVSFGLERLFLAILEDAYKEELIENTNKYRSFLKINPIVTPYFASVLFVDSRLKNKAYSLYISLLKIKDFNVSFENSNSIGKSYRKQDNIGTYYCITVDFEIDTITYRNRDNMKQKRIKIIDLESFLINEYKNIYDNFISYYE